MAAPSLLREALGTPFEWVRDIAISAVFSAWMGAIGPFGAYHSAPLERRLACYLSMSLVTVLVYGFTGRVALAWGRRHSVSPWITLNLNNLLVSIPMSQFVAFMVPFFLPRARFAVSPLGWYFQTAILMVPVGIAYLCAFAILERIRAPAPAAKQASDTAKEAGPRLTQRLSDRVRGAIIALEAEDHYVRVHTRTGSELLLMRFSDAVAELGDLAGLRPHRSWWVSRDAVSEQVTRGRGARLRLTNGLEVPVARASQAQVRSALSAA